MPGSRQSSRDDRLIVDATRTRTESGHGSGPTAVMARQRAGKHVEVGPGVVAFVSARYCRGRRYRFGMANASTHQRVEDVESVFAKPFEKLQEAVRLAPRDAEFHFKLALAWNELGDSTNVCSELEEAVKLDPRNALAGYNLGLARNAAGNPTGAIEALLAAESIDPRDPRIPYARATIQARLGQREQARQAARRALELNPQFAEAATLLRQLK